VELPVSAKEGEMKRETEGKRAWAGKIGFFCKHNMI
jgi:hypothetical protein